MYNFWQVEPTVDSMSHTGNRIDGEQVLGKYYENTAKRQNYTGPGLFFPYPMIEKVHSDKMML